MSEKVQVELSGDEAWIVEVYRIEHSKKSSEEAIREIINRYHMYQTGYRGIDKKKWFQRLQV